MSGVIYFWMFGDWLFVVVVFVVSIFVLMFKFGVLMIFVISV